MAPCLLLVCPTFKGKPQCIIMEPRGAINQCNLGISISQETTGRFEACVCRKISKRVSEREGGPQPNLVIFRQWIG
jgi:hypothetical protein